VSCRRLPQGRRTRWVYCSQPVVMSAVPSTDGLCPQGHEFRAQHQKNRLAPAHACRSLKNFNARLTAAVSQLSQDIFSRGSHPKNSATWKVANANGTCPASSCVCYSQPHTHHDNPSPTCHFFRVEGFSDVDGNDSGVHQETEGSDTG